MSGTDALAFVGLGVLGVLAAVGIAYCVRSAAKSAAAPRDAGPRAGAYTIPYVACIRGVRAGLAILIVSALVLLVLAVSVDRRLWAMLIVVLLLLAVVASWSRYRLRLEEDFLAYRFIRREHIIGYEEIENVAPLWSVVATGRGVGVNVALRLGLRGERRPVEIQLTLLAQRERAIVVDHLRRHAPNASFSSNLHSLWTRAF